MIPFRLALLEPHRATLEKCVYCPKLSRASCPVSNAESSETVTPWGKMSIAYFAARGDVPIDAAHADPAWACSACYGCRERCDHKNEVATVLTDTRAEMFERGVAPEAAKRIAATWSSHAAEAARAADKVDDGRGSGASLLLGCGYAEHAPEVARDALRVAERLRGGPVRPVRACCGLPLLYAGDRKGFAKAARSLAAEVASSRDFFVLDPGCARAVLVEYEQVGVTIRRPELLIDLAADFAERNRATPSALKRIPGPVRYHDPCQLGRGLGRYDEPRAILRAVTGEEPGRFIREREHAECSGAGGLLPATRPETSRSIAEARIAEHRDLGGGTLVTGCAQSLRRFNRSGEPAKDWVSLFAASLFADQ